MNVDSGPHSSIPHVVATIWRDALHVSVLDLDDDFFLLGGDSLAAIEITLKVRSAVFLEVPIELLFERSNFRDYVAAVEAAVRPESG